MAPSGLQKNQSLLNKLAAANAKLSNSVSKGASKLKELNKNTKDLTSSTEDHQAKVKQSKAVFDVHKQTIQALSTEFNKIKGISGTFGPSLQDAAKGFNTMKTGLSIVKTGFKGVGTAIKETGFGFLLQLLQKAFDYFVNTSEGSKMLKGAISAIGVVLNTVKGFFEKFKSGIIDAVTHPVESLKTLGKMIVDNVINRFKAFSVILDGIIHLDFKKMADGVLQAATGVAHATDKIAKAVKDIGNSAKALGKDMTDAYVAGTKMSDHAEKKAGEIKKLHAIQKQASNDHVTQKKEAADEIERMQKESLIRQLQATGDYYSAAAAEETDRYKEEQAKLEKLYSDKLISQQKYEEVKKQLEAENLANIASINKEYNDKDRKATENKMADLVGLSGFSLAIAAVKAIEEQKQKAKTDAAEKAAKQRADFEIQTTQKVSDTAFSIINKSIQAQSDAKIRALEKDKSLELGNKSLTSAQKMAIDAKYKKQEGAIKAKAFKDEQKLSIMQAIINGALAITKAESELGPVAGTIAVAGVIANTALQIATIASQKPPAYAKGGLHYSSDGKGGVLSGYSKYDNTNAFLRSGEGIVVSEAMQVPWARNLVSAINVGFVGRDFSAPVSTRGFAVGGIFTDGGNANRYYSQPMNDQKNLANTIAYQMINNFPPVYVDVKDVNNQQNILAQTVNRVNL